MLGQTEEQRMVNHGFIQAGLSVSLILPFVIACTNIELKCRGSVSVDAYLSTFENFPGVESARQLVSDILPIARGRYK